MQKQTHHRCSSQKLSNNFPNNKKTAPHNKPKNSADISFDIDMDGDIHGTNQSPQFQRVFKQIHINNQKYQDNSNSKHKNKSIGNSNGKGDGISCYLDKYKQNQLYSQVYSSNTNAYTHAQNVKQHKVLNTSITKQLQNMQQQNQRLSSQNKKYRKQIFQLKTRNQTLQTQLQGHKQKIKKLEQQRNKFKTKYTQFQSKLEQIQQQKQQIAHKLKVKQKQIAKMEQIQRQRNLYYEEVFNKKQKEIQKLKNQLSKKMEEIYAQVSCISEENSRNYGSLGNLVNMKDKQIVLLKDQLTERQKQLTQSKKTTESTQKQLKSQLQALQSQNNQLQNQIQTQTLIIQQLNTKYNQSEQFISEYNQLMIQLKSKQQTIVKLSDRIVVQKQKFQAKEKELYKQIQVKNQNGIRIAGVVGQAIALLQENLLYINESANTNLHSASYKRFTTATTHSKNSIKNILDESELKTLTTIVMDVIQSNKTIIKRKKFQLQEFRNKYEMQFNQLDKKMGIVLQQNESLKFQINMLKQHLKNHQDASFINNKQFVTNMFYSQPCQIPYRNSLHDSTLPKLHKNTICEQIYHSHHANRHKQAEYRINKDQFTGLEKQQQLLRKNLRFLKSQRNRNLQSSQRYSSSTDKIYKQKTPQQSLINQKLNIKKQVQKARKIYNQTTLTHNYDNQSLYPHTQKSSHHKSMSNLSKQTKISYEKYMQ